MKKDSVAKNFSFQLLYQVLLLVLPLVMSPYLTRSLGSEPLGIFSYANSVAYYFILFANLGISRHGQRTISEKKGDVNEIRKAFWGLFYLHFIISCIVSAFYFIFFCLFYGDLDRTVFIIEGIYVASAVFDVTWLFYGIESFKNVVIKNAIIKLVECALVFIFVKSANDLWIYSLITSCGILFGQAIMFFQAAKTYPMIKTAWSDVKQHFKPLIVFSISVFAVSLYTVFDKVLLGLLSTKANVAFYEYSNKIISIPRTFISIIGTVLFPKACQLASVGDVNGQKKYIHISLLITSFIGMATFWGLLAIAKSFAISYFGDEFAECGPVMMSLALLPFIVGIGDIVRTQFMIPNHMDLKFNLCIFLNAVINVCLSALLIPSMGVYGAIIGTCSAELFGCIFQLIMCRSFLSIKSILKTTTPFVIIGAVMYVTIKTESLFLPDGILPLVIVFLSGAAVFSVLSAMYLCLFEKDLWKYIKSMILKR